MRCNMSPALTLLATRRQANRRMPQLSASPSWLHSLTDDEPSSRGQGGSRLPCHSPEEPPVPSASAVCYLSVTVLSDSLLSSTRAGTGWPMVNCIDDRLYSIHCNFAASRRSVIINQTLRKLSIDLDPQPPRPMRLSGHHHIPSVHSDVAVDRSNASRPSHLHIYLSRA